MHALTIRLPDDMYERLKATSTRHGISVNQLICDMAAVLLDDLDIEIQFHTRADRGLGNTAQGVALLRKAKWRQRWPPWRTVT